MSHSNGDGIVGRTEFMGLNGVAKGNLRSIGPILDEALGPVLDRFYERVRAIAETRRFFAGEQQISAAKSLQRPEKMSGFRLDDRAGPGGLHPDRNHLMAVNG
jgi:hypothetical protein